MSFRLRRRGFTLLDVALSAVVLTIGTLFIGGYFSHVYDQLNPRSGYGGLRRFLMAEQLIKAEAEGLRLLRAIPANPGSCRLVSPPANSGYVLNITQSIPAGSPDSNKAEMYLFDIGIDQPSGTTINKLTMSTVRYTDLNEDAKIGL